MRRLQHLGSPPTEHQPSLSRWRAAVLIPTITLSLLGCVYDSDKQCGNGQVVLKGGIERCVCEANYAYTPTGCVPCAANETGGPNGSCICKQGFGKADPMAACTACGANEVTSPTGSCQCAPNFGRSEPTAACTPCGQNETTGATGACECKAGFGRTSPQEPCVRFSALGLECDTQATPCADATYSYCHAASGTAGYCTSQGCATSADCEGGYTCSTAISPSYCHQPFSAAVGVGKPCTTDADCAGTEATYCDLFVTFGCLVQGCTLAPDNCPTGYECCDLSAYMVPQPLCVSIALGGCIN